MTELEFDVVIVGSGAGGGTVARALAPLAQQGARIAVLERGPKFRPEDFTGNEVVMSRRLYAKGGGFLTKDMAMTLAFAHAYGGSTVVYTGTSLVIQPETLARWNVPGLTADDVTARARRYLDENEVIRLPEEKINTNNRLFREGCRALGYRVEQFPVNVKGCQGAGMCNMGCPNGAKQGTHKVQLPIAQKAGVTVVTDARVHSIADGVCDVRVEPAGIGEPSVWSAGDYRVRARAVVVAGGAIGSPALLLRSKLDAPLPALGRYFTCHPAMILVAQHDRKVHGFWGHPKSFYCDAFARTQRFLLETCMYFPFITAKSLAGFGADHSAMMGRMDQLQMILSLAIDDPLHANRVGVDASGEPFVDYTLTDAVKDSLVASMKAAARIFFAAGARRVHVPAARSFFIEAADAGRLDDLIGRDGLRAGRESISAAHLMGGCRMGAGPSTSVTDAWGQVHGVPWLFVADASLFPAAAEINPYVTIMALADRVAERVTAVLGQRPALARSEGAVA